MAARLYRWLVQEDGTGSDPEDEDSEYHSSLSLGKTSLIAPDLESAMLFSYALLLFNLRVVATIVPVASHDHKISRLS